MDKTEPPRHEPEVREQDLLRQLEIFQGQIQSAASQARDSRDRLDSTLRELESLKTAHSALAKERDEVRDEALAALDESEAELAALRAQVGTLQGQNNKLIAEEEKWAREKQIHASSLHGLEALLQEARGERARFQSESSRNAEELQSLRQQATRQTEEIQKALQEKAAAQAALKQHQEAAAKSGEEVAPLKKAVLELDTKLKLAEQALQQSRAENGKQQQHIKELEEKQAAQQKKLEADFHRSLREKEEALSGRSSELETARQSHTLLMDRLQLNQRELEAIRLERKNLEQNLFAARENSDQSAKVRAELELKEQEIAAKETENRQFREQQDQAKQKLSEMESLLAGLRQEKQRLAASVDKIKEDAAGQLGAALAAKDSEIRDLQARLEARNQDLEVARKKIEVRQQAAETEEEKVRTLERHVARLKAQIQDEETEWQQALDTVEQFRAQALQLSNAKQALESDLLLKQRELSARLVESSVLKDQLQTLQGSLSMMKSELLQLRTQVQPGRDNDWILSGIAILAQQARGGNTDVKGILKAWLSESEGASATRPPVNSSLSAPASIPTGWTAPAPSTVQITPPDLIPGSSPVFGTTGHHLRQLEKVDLPGDLAITLDDLRCAVLDPAWREKWKLGEKPNAFQGPSAAHRGKAGEVFTLVARDFLDWLTQPEGVNDPAQFGEKELWQYMYELFAAERLDRMVQRNDFEATNFLSRRLRSFCRRLDALKQRTPGFHSWNDLLRPEMRTVDRVVFPLHERRLVVQGRLYGLRVHPKHGMEMADWKVFPESEDAADLADLALQTLIFHKAHPESAFSATVEFYTQDFSAREVSRADLNHVLRSRVVPAFYDLAGMPKPPGMEESALDFFPPSHATEIVSS